MSSAPSQTGGDLAQMVERSLSMREVLGSMPRFSKAILVVPYLQAWIMLMLNKLTDTKFSGNSISQM